MPNFARMTADKLSHFLNNFRNIANANLAALGYSTGDITDARARTLVRSGHDRAVVLRITLAPSAGVVDGATFHDYALAHFVRSAKETTVRNTNVLRVRAKGASFAVFRAPDGVGWFVVASSNSVVDAETEALVAAVGG